MLPCTGPDQVKKLGKKLKGDDPVKCLQEMSPEQLSALNVWSETELEQVQHALTVITNLDFEVEVENADNLSEEDIVCLKIKITRKNLPEGTEAGFIHSNNFPYLKKELLLINVCDVEGRRFLMNTVVDNPAREVEESLKTQFRHIGKVTLKVSVSSDVYIGRSVTKDIEFELKSKDQIVDTFKYHPDDLKSQKTLFEEMMEAAQEQENSDDDLEDEDGNVVKQEKDENEEESD
jgi:hypothetical protein